VGIRVATDATDSLSAAGKSGTKVGGARSAARSSRRQNWDNPGPRRVGQVGVVESSAHRMVPLARISALSRQRSTFQTPSKPLTLQGSEYAHAVQELNKAVERADGLLLA
jgi:hypothetical protein